MTPALSVGGRHLDLIQSTPGRPEVQTPVWSPDGQRIAYLGRRDGNKELYVLNADGSGQRRLARDATFFATPAWSPDGRTLAFEAERDGTIGVYSVNADGSGRRRLARNGSAPAWSPDGRTLAFFSGTRIYLMDAGGSEHRPLTKPLKCCRKSSLAWSPDGRKLAFLIYRDCAQSCGLYVVRNDGSGLRNLTWKLATVSGKDAGAVSDSAWSPDGRRLAFVRLNTNFGDWDPIYVVEADGSGLRNLTPKPVGIHSAPVWSPNGRKIAFAGERDGNSDVYVMNANGSGQRNLTRNPAFDSDPTWSPDGRKLAFVSNRDGSYRVYVMNADGSGQRRLTQRNP